MYLKDSYLKECISSITAIDGKKVLLERTVFYPRSGGQPCDLGTITRGKDVFHVVSVEKKDGKNWHEVDREGLQIGDFVMCVIDWERRYQLMKNHTAAHIISEVIHRESKALITGNQLDLDKSRIDFSLDDFDPEKMKEFIDEANRIVGMDLPISVRFMDRDEAMKLAQVSKLAKGLPSELKELRIVSIGAFDVQADGGTHVASTKEIGKIELLKCENKGKNNRRMYFRVCSA